MESKFNGVRVFSTTMHKDHDAMGGEITRWLADNDDIEIVDKVVTQSSDNAYHCLTITLFYNRRA